MVLPMFICCIISAYINPIYILYAAREMGSIEYECLIISVQYLPDPLYIFNNSRNSSSNVYFCLISVRILYFYFYGDRSLRSCARISLCQIIYIVNSAQNGSRDA